MGDKNDFHKWNLLKKVKNLSTQAKNSLRVLSTATMRTATPRMATVVQMTRTTQKRIARQRKHKQHNGRRQGRARDMQKALCGNSAVFLVFVSRDYRTASIVIWSPPRGVSLSPAFLRHNLWLPQLHTPSRTSPERLFSTLLPLNQFPIALA